jgi:4-hydroxybenzoyl-CoA reductase subunit beta
MILRNKKSFKKYKMETSEKLYLQPKTISEALEFALQHTGNFKYIAGGTDAIANDFQGNNTAECLIDITGIDELNIVRESAEYLKIGSLVKLSELKNHDLIKNRFPVLIEAADSVGTPLIRNSATIGGNLLCENRCIYFNQSEWWRRSVGYCLKCSGDMCIVTGTDKACYSEFVSDTAPVLISLGAILEVVGSNGESTVKLEDIYTGDGVKPIKLDKITIIKSILIPLNMNYSAAFRKIRQRESLEFTSLTAAVTVDKNDNVRIALSGIDPKPVVVTGTTQSGRDDLIKAALSKSRSVDNEMLTRKYRRDMIRVTLSEIFEGLFTT